MDKIKHDEVLSTLLGMFETDMTPVEIAKVLAERGVSPNPWDWVEICRLAVDYVRCD